MEFINKQNNLSCCITDRIHDALEPLLKLSTELCPRDQGAEVKGEHAVGFIENGPKREISFIPERAAKACWDCQECFTICPTSYAQAAYLLTEALAFPGRRRISSPKKLAR